MPDPDFRQEVILALQDKEGGLAGALENLVTVTEQMSVTLEVIEKAATSLRMLAEAAERHREATGTTPEDRWSKLVQIEADRERRYAEKEERLREAQQIKAEEIRLAREAKSAKWWESQQAKDRPADDTPKEAS